MLLGLPLSSRKVMAEGLKSPQAGKVVQPLRVPSVTRWTNVTVRTLKSSAEPCGMLMVIQREGAVVVNKNVAELEEMHSLPGSWERKPPSVIRRRNSDGRAISLDNLSN